MHRRQLLTMLALGGLLGAGFAGRARAWLRPLAGGRPGAPLVGLLKSPGSAAAVGRAYLGAYPQEADAARLAMHLESALRAQGLEPRRAPAPRLRAALAEQSRADFAAGQIVRVEGWVLSRSEARLCALAALSAPVA